jgi:Lysophospholipase L1 and related esterases
MRFWGNVRRSLGKILLLALSLLICVTAALEGTGTVSCKAEEAESPKWEGDRIYCVAFGDSIAKGYGGKGQEDLRCYTQLIADAVTVEARIPAQCDKFAKNGRDSLRLNTEILSTEEALAALDRADIITLTIGANDLMQEFKKAAQEVLGTDRKFLSVFDAFDALQEGVEGNPLLIVKILDVLNNWDYTAFEEQWLLAMETITEHRKDTAQMVVTNIYNPVSRFELPGAMNDIVEDIIQNMNQIMYDHSEAYDYHVVDLFDSEICEHTQEDGLHPDQEGQELIARLAAEKIDTGIFKGEPEKIIRDEPRPRMAVRRRYSLWTVLGPLPWIALIILVCMTAVVLIWYLKRKRGGESQPLYQKRNKNKDKND